MARKRISTLLVCAGVLALPLAGFATDKEHCYLRDASSPAAGIAYLVCDQGLVYATADNGANWATLDTGATVTLHAIAFSDATHGFVVGDSGTLLATADGGKTWQPRATGTKEHLLTVFALGKMAWAAGFDGTLIFSSDGGNTWAKQNSGSSMGLENIFFLDQDHGWAVGWSGTILRTVNGGKQWEGIKSDAASWSLAAVRFRDLKTGWAVGFSGQLLRSQDGGVTWEAQKSAVQSWLTSVAIDSGNRIWIAADDRFLVSDDGGSQWRVLPADNDIFVAKVFPVGNSLWALGELGIMKQTGNGLQWKLDDKLVPAGANIASSLDDASSPSDKSR